MTWLLCVLVPMPGRGSRSSTQTLCPRCAIGQRRGKADDAGADDGGVDGFHQLRIDVIRCTTRADRYCQLRSAAAGGRPQVTVSADARARDRRRRPARRAIVEAFATARSSRTPATSLDITDPAAVRTAVGDAAPGRHHQLRRVQRRGRRRSGAARGAGRQRVGRAQPGACGRRRPARRSCTTAPTSCSTATAREPYDEDAPPSPQQHLCRVEAARRMVRARGAARPTCCASRACSDRRADWTGRRGTLDGIVDGLEAAAARSGSSPIASCRRATRRTSRRRRGTWSMTGAPPGLYHCVNAGHATWHEVARGGGASCSASRRGSCRSRSTRCR